MSSKRKNTGDVPGGLPCKEDGCSSVVKFFSSLERHLNTVHRMDPFQAKAVVDQARLDNGEYKFIKLDHRTLCPVERCGLSFTFRFKYESHLKNDHGIGNLEELAERTTVRFWANVHCPKCTPSTTNEWKRADHLTDHLAKVHGLGEEECIQTVLQVRASLETDSPPSENNVEGERASVEEAESALRLQIVPSCMILESLHLPKSTVTLTPH